MKHATHFLVLLPLILGAGCGDSDAASASEAWVWDLPENIPPPRVPEDNPMSVAKVELGRFLFYDTRLSAKSTGDIHPRNSMMVANAGYAASLTWANNVLEKLEEQALVPMFGEDPVELGMANMEDELLRRMREDERYPDMFAAAFPGERDPIVLGNITKAIAAFQRQLTSFGSRVDKDELNASERNGKRLFFGGETEAGVTDALECGRQLPNGQPGALRPNVRSRAQGTVQAAKPSEHRDHGALHA
jgi:cytochrome c peroxidase